jgi:hypothetical protein
MGTETFRGGRQTFSTIKDRIAKVVRTPDENTHIVAGHMPVEPETARKWGNRFASATIVSFLASVPAEEMVSRDAAYLSLGAGWFIASFAAGAFIEAGNPHNQPEFSASEGLHSSPTERA